MPVLPLPRDPEATALPTAGEVVVFDLEWTSWEGSHARGWSEPWEWREVVQFGAVRADAGDGFRVVAEMEALVVPARNPRLSDYFTRLTGIDSTHLAANGGSFADAQDRFAAFCGPTAPLFMNGADGMILRENCALNGLRYPFAEDRAWNIRPLLAKVTGLEPGRLVSCTLPEVLGIPDVPGRHTGLGDAYAITAALAELRRRGLL